MIINLKNTTMVPPTEEMSKRSLLLSNLDLLYPVDARTSYIYFYRSNGSSDFFSPNPMKEALGRALVLFYPIAGRLRKDPDGRLEIDCNGHGVLFAEAETTSLLDDLHDFSSISEFKNLIPTVDYSGGISSFPLCAIQLTYFKCGGASVGVEVNHIVADGIATTHFINTWAEIGRGLEPSLPPVHDRSLLRGCGDPPEPKFEHMEYQPLAKLIKKDEAPQGTTCRIFKLNRDQMNALKAKSTTHAYTTNDIVSGHIWRCAWLAQGLGKATATLHIVVNGRPRLQQPTLPLGYFGNAVFIAATDGVGDQLAKHSWYAASRVHQAVARTDNEYMTSAIDCLELQPHTFRSPNLSITTWRWFPVSDSDFGWGKPVFMGPTPLPFHGTACILPCPVNDGSISFVMCLQVEDMKLFETYIYDI